MTAVKVEPHERVLRDVQPERTERRVQQRVGWADPTHGAGAARAALIAATIAARVSGVPFASSRHLAKSVITTADSGGLRKATVLVLSFTWPRHGVMVAGPMPAGRVRASATQEGPRLSNRTPTAIPLHPPCGQERSGSGRISMGRPGSASPTAERS